MIHDYDVACQLLLQVNFISHIYYQVPTITTLTQDEFTKTLMVFLSVTSQMTPAQKPSTKTSRASSRRWGAINRLIPVKSNKVAGTHHGKSERNSIKKKKIRALISTEGRSLLLVHYSGHSWVGGRNEPMLDLGAKAKLICWSRLLRYEPIDILVILDSCYSFLATRAQPAERVVEVVAAVKASDTTLKDTARTVSFSSRLANYLARCQENGPISIDFAAAIAAISASRKPTHEIVFGDTSIGVQLGSLPQDRTALSPLQAVLQHYAIVQIHLADVFDEVCHKAFQMD